MNDASLVDKVNTREQRAEPLSCVMLWYLNGNKARMICPNTVTMSVTRQKADGLYSALHEDTKDTDNYSHRNHGIGGRNDEFVKGDY